MIILNRSLSWVVALCRISSSAVGLISGVPTSAAPRLVLQISDLHLRRYPIHNAPLAMHYLSAPLAMHYLSDILSQPEVWYLFDIRPEVWYLFDIRPEVWYLFDIRPVTGLASNLYVQIMYKLLQHQTALQLFSTMGEASHLCRFTLVVGRFD